MPYLIGGLVLAVLIVVYVLAYKWNEKTKAPEGCEFPDGFSGCGGCTSASCVSRVDPAKK